MCTTSQKFGDTEMVMFLKQTTLQYQIDEKYSAAIANIEAAELKRLIIGEH